MVSKFIVPSLIACLAWVSSQADHLGDLERRPADTISAEEMSVVAIKQEGDLTNCGPTAAAILVSAYQGITASRKQHRLRDTLGRWSWGRFPLRSWHLPGRDPGMITPTMMQAMLTRFGQPTRYPELVPDTWARGEDAMGSLHRVLAQRRPVVVLVESPILWRTDRPGLHWIVVFAMTPDEVRYVDPWDATPRTIERARFVSAWRLSPMYRLLPGFRAFTAFVGSRPMPPKGRMLQRQLAWTGEVPGALVGDEASHTSEGFAHMTQWLELGVEHMLNNPLPVEHIGGTSG